MLNLSQTDSVFFGACVDAKLACLDSNSCHQHHLYIRCLTYLCGCRALNLLCQLFRPCQSLTDKNLTAGFYQNLASAMWAADCSVCSSKVIVLMTSFGHLNGSSSHHGRPSHWLYFLYWLPWTRHRSLISYSLKSVYGKFDLVWEISETLQKLMSV